MTSGIPSTDHISSLTHLLHSHLDEELGGELNRAGLDSRLSALPVCPKMRLGERTVSGVPCGEMRARGLIACRTLVDRNRPLVANKTGPTRLGFALMLKFFELEAPLPTPRAATPAPASRR